MSESIDQSVHHRFSSRWGFLLSVIGIAVGTGNIWRFPRIVAKNGTEKGAGAFLVAWIVFLLLWSIPLVLAEYALGRKCAIPFWCSTEWGFRAASLPQPTPNPLPIHR